MSPEQIASVPPLGNAQREEDLHKRIVAFFEGGHERVAAELKVAFSHLGPTYRDYLNSPLWKRVIRPRVLKRDNYLCRRCGGTANRVHHKSYAPEVLAGNCDEELASICEGCHDFIHFDDSGKPRSEAETARLLAEPKTDICFPAPKYDLRKDRTYKYPAEWRRMSAVERAAWSREYDRQRCLRLLKKHRNNAVWVNLLTRQLREVHGIEIKSP
jgi:hypothetical protein